MNKYSFTLLLIFLSNIILQSCSGTFILGTAAVATKILKDPRTLGTQINDKTLEIHISNALAKNQKIKNTARIITTVYQGKILLVGQSPSVNIIRQAEKIIMNITKQNTLYNEIRHTQPITIQNILTDLWINTKIYAHCLIKHDIRLSNIKIITENKEVFLLGQVSYKEKNKIIQELSKIHGIKHIIIGCTNR